MKIHSRSPRREADEKLHFLGAAESQQQQKKGGGDGSDDGGEKGAGGQKLAKKGEELKEEMTR